MAIESIRLKKTSLLAKISEASYYSILIIILGAVIFGILMVKSRTIGDFFTDPIFIGYTLFVTIFQLSRLVSAMFYNRSFSLVVPKEDTLKEIYEPYVSFVVPCMNEEGAIRETVTKCFAADYPKEKIEVIVINDGSTDRTIDILRELEKEYENLTIIDWKINRGKRHGMAAGFKKAKGEIVVQLDSDSFMEPKTFREIVKPFANPEIGAVCAHADPQNSDVNMLTKMQTAYYFMSFKILKAAESTYHTVFCCSGCSSAYRKEAVMDILDEFMDETFLGLPITWGDDRALTNWVLKKGYKTIYTDRALAYTIVPTTFKQFIKQQIRWKKGWFVNSIFALKFIVKKQPFVSFTYFLPLILVTVMTPFMAARALLYTSTKNPGNIIFYFSGVFLMASVITIYYRFVARDNKYWPYLFVWAATNTVFLSFLFFYAMITIQNRKWGTR